MANLNPFLPAAEASVVRMRGRVLACTILVTSGVAWFALWRWGSSPTARYSHAHIHFAAQTQAGLLLAFLAGWTLMLVAMMLPTSLPLLALFSRLTSERRDHWTLVSLVVAGYVAIWLLFGVPAYFATDLLVRIFGLEHWMHMHARWLAAGTAILAGSYQFTPLKYRCLEKCRSPFSFIAEHWTGHDEVKQALWLGAHHGLFCVGCCWSLMLLMFTIGAGSIAWMLVLGTLMAVEKNSPWGKRFARVLGFGLMLIGMGVSLGLWPTG
jgi:predicted metal-binding membrane protein